MKPHPQSVVCKTDYVKHVTTMVSTCPISTGNDLVTGITSKAVSKQQSEVSDSGQPIGGVLTAAGDTFGEGELLYISFRGKLAATLIGCSPKGATLRIHLIRLRRHPRS